VRGASVVGSSGRCRLAPTYRDCPEGELALVSALSCSVALVR
jgi:hypothetical protein